MPSGKGRSYQRMDATPLAGASRRSFCSTTIAVVSTSLHNDLMSASELISSFETRIKFAIKLIDRLMDKPNSSWGPLETSDTPR